MSRRTTRITGAAALAVTASLLAACSSSGSTASVAAAGSASPAATSSAGASSSAAASGAVVSPAPTTNPAWKQFHFVIADNGGDGTQSLAGILGTFKNASYSVSFARFSYGPPLVEALVTGKADIGPVGDVPPITGSATEYGFKIVGIERPFNQGQSGEDILVKANSSIKTLAGLKGKTIAVPQGSSAHGLVLLALNSVGLKPSDVKLDFLDPAAGAQAFASGQVDAWAIWNPQATLAVEHSGGRVLVYGRPPIDQDNSYYVASQSDLANPVKRAALADVLERIGQQYAYAQQHLNVYAQAIEQEDGISAADALAYVKTQQFRIDPIRNSDIQAENQLSALFYQSGQIKTQVNVATIVSNLLPAGYDSSKSNIAALPAS